MSNNTNVIPWRRWFFLRTELDQVITLSMVFSGCMLVVRVLWTGHLTFLFLVWNLFLAYIPYMLTNWLQHQALEYWNKWKFWLVFVGWLLFIPNSFYIITDLFHFGNYYMLPQWFDLVFILSCAWNGLLLGLLSVRQMEKILTPHLSHKPEIFFVYPIMWMNALGVYIGRYLRFNSWDILTNPFGVITDIIKMMIHPVRYRDAWGMILCFSIFMTLVYMAIKRIHKAIG